MTELLWQKKALSPVSPPQEIVLSFKEEFLSELANIPKDEGNLDTSSSAITGLLKSIIFVFTTGLIRCSTHSTSLTIGSPWSST